MAETTSVGSRIRARRTELSITRERLAVECGISVATIARLENRDQVPRAETLATLAHRLDLSLDQLMSEVGSQPRRHR